MILFKEGDNKGLLNTQIENLVGTPVSIKEQIKKGFTGSSLFRLVSFNLKDEILDSSHFNIRCNFEKRSKGLIIRNNQNQKLFNLAIDYNSIQKITIITDEKVSPALISPMSILLKLGVHIRYARYFKIISFSEYSIGKLILLIRINQGEIEFDSNGYNFYTVKDYFSSSELTNKIEIINRNA